MGPEGGQSSVLLPPFKKYRCSAPAMTLEKVRKIWRRGSYQAEEIGLNRKGVPCSRNLIRTFDLNFLSITKTCLYVYMSMYT